MTRGRHRAAGGGAALALWPALATACPFCAARAAHAGAGRGLWALAALVLTPFLLAAAGLFWARRWAGDR